MDLLIDTNIAIDVFTKRMQFFNSSKKVLDYCIQDGCRGVFWTGEITAIHYLLLKPLDKEAAREYVRMVLALYEVVDVTPEDMEAAVDSGMSDFEDAVLAYCAKRAKVDYIITRNTKDFEGSPVKAITPDDFLQRISDKAAER